MIRGNSGSGKTSVAKAVRAAYGRGLAVVGQDNVRREILRERDVPSGANIGLIDTITRYSLEHGYHVVLEGILTASRYATMLQALRRDHPANSTFFYLDVSIEETLRRPMRMEVSGEQMREWYRHLDLLSDDYETVIPENSPLATTVQQVLDESGLASRKVTPRRGGRPLGATELALPETMLNQYIVRSLRQAAAKSFLALCAASTPCLAAFCSPVKPCFWDHAWSRRRSLNSASLTVLTTF